VLQSKKALFDISADAVRTWLSRFPAKCTLVPLQSALHDVQMPCSGRIADIAKLNVLLLLPAMQCMS
jgi:hypothetical protein